MLQSEMSMITGMTQKYFNKTRFSQPFIEYFLCQPGLQDMHHSVSIVQLTKDIQFKVHKGLNSIDLHDIYNKISKDNEAWTEI